MCVRPLSRGEQEHLPMYEHTIKRDSHPERYSKLCLSNIFPEIYRQDGWLAACDHRHLGSDGHIGEDYFFKTDSGNGVCGGGRAEGGYTPYVGRNLGTLSSSFRRRVLGLLDLFAGSKSNETCIAVPDAPFLMWLRKPADC